MKTNILRVDKTCAYIYFPKNIGAIAYKQYMRKQKDKENRAFSTKNFKIF